MEMFDVFTQFFSLVPLLGALVVLLSSYIISSSLRTCEKEPPGPKALPILGNLLQLDFRSPWKTFVEFSKKYGPVFTVYMGGKKVVVLAGYKTLKEALVNYADVFGLRERILIIQEFSKEHGVIWSNGDSWMEMRRFVLTNLRDFGMGRKVCEDKIIEECQHLTGVLETFKGEAFDVSLPVYCAVSNIICSMVYGHRFDYEDPEFRTLVKDTRRRNELLFSPSVQMYNMFPWLLKWIATRKEFQKLNASSQEKNLKMLKHLRETLNPQKCRGIVDTFMVHMQRLEESGISNSHFHKENLLYTTMNLFSGGTDTTATTLRWGLLLMAKHPHIQNQVQEELSRVVGRRQVQVEDRKNLPFTNAVIHETQRVANITPTSLPHVTNQDVVFQGHFIKKGTTVYPLLASALLDETEWKHPHTFYPAHFLDKEGKFFKPDAFLPFSAGRRACPGEGLARMELFIFLATLLQHFCFTPGPGVSPEELHVNPSVGFTHSPAAYSLCAVSRM